MIIYNNTMGPAVTHASRKPGQRTCQRLQINIRHFSETGKEEDEGDFQDKVEKNEDKKLNN